MRRSVMAFLMVGSVLQAAEYWYPVAATDQTIFYLYQKSCSEIELWSLDLTTNQLTTALPAGTVPGFVSVACNRGFSFVDQHILKFKAFIKRSPGIIELDKPLRMMGKVTWLDEKGYLAALFREHRGIFLISLSGQVMPLVVGNYDASCPFLVDNKFFFVVNRNDAQSGYSCEICVGSYADSVVHDFSMVYFVKNPIISLTMVSQTEGFFIEENSISTDFVTFSFYYFKQSKPYWKSELLFQFFIPNSLIIGNKSERVYESIFPFLPFISAHLIYFCSSDKPDNAGQSVNIFSFSRVDKTIQQITHAREGQHCFAPFVHHETLYHGESREMVSAS